jgi:hypothetical protein
MTIYRVTNREDRNQFVNRYVTYDLQAPLPHEWDEWPLNDKGIWLNENATFISDEFSEPEVDSEMNEETLEIEVDALQGDI